MKITCQACAAKYTIADEKVLGKIVKIRCKKCGATIVVNGSDAPASPGAGAQAPPAYDYAGQQPAGEPWTVNVADGDQRTMSDAEIVAAYRAGVVDDETFCWKDGMNDWLALREVGGLYEACTATRADDGGAGDTKIQAPDPALLRAHAAPAHAAPVVTASNGDAVAMAAPAARRVGGRAPAADLFGGAAQAGGEDDVMTSAPAGMPQPHDDPTALTGARNENSVLFSLNALTGKGPGGARAPMAASSEASGLIDIRQLGAQIGIGDDKKQRRLDDIMNLAGGGAFSPSLGAPVLAPPPIEEYAPRPQGAGAPGGLRGASRSRGVILLAVGGGVLVVAGAIGVALTFMGRTDTSDTAKAAASASAAASAAGAPSASLAAATTDTTATATASAADSATAAAPASSGEAAGAASASKPAIAATSTAATATAATTATTKATTTTAATTAPTTTAAAAGADQPFNMGEAKARLAAIAGSVQGCKRGDASGAGRVVVTFAPSGGVSSAVVSGPPFEGTPTGACVASRFRGAHVPAFSGSPFSVSKSFTIN